VLVLLSSGTIEQYFLSVESDGEADDSSDLRVLRLNLITKWFYWMNEDDLWTSQGFATRGSWEQHQIRQPQLRKPPTSNRWIPCR